MAISNSANVNPTVRPHDADASQAFGALFSRESASEVEIAQLAAICTRVVCSPGRSLTTKGQPAEVAYIIASGFARMELASDDHPLGAAALRAGDWAGEALLAGDDAHGHNILAASDLVMFACERGDLHNLAQRMPQLAARLTAAVMEQSMRRSRLQTNKMTSIAQAALGIAAPAAAEPASSEGTSFGRLFSKLTGKGG
ncbi:MAG: Crp/Fnr family transcriptional regulator [Deltaproteobacteria bacterium]|nr:Crp/Fnr family transcriptional regulator [Deltaproteobacteria bacterium]